MLTAPRTLKDFIHLHNHKKEIFDLNKRHDTIDENLPNKYFFTNNFIADIFLFVTAIILLLVTNLAIYLLCIHKKLRTLVASLALQQVRELGTVTTHEEVTNKYKIQIYIILALTSTMLCLVIFAVLHSRKLCRGHLFSNTVKVILFIVNVKYYVPLKLCKLQDVYTYLKLQETKIRNVKLR